MAKSGEVCQKCRRDLSPSQYAPNDGPKKVFWRGQPFCQQCYNRVRSGAKNR